MKKILSIFTLLIVLLLTSCDIGRSGPDGIDPCYVKSITVINSESTFEFYYGEFDPSLIKIHIERANETQEDISVTYDMIKTDLTKLVVGQNTIMCEYLYDVNNPEEPYKFFFNITIKEKDDLRFTYRADQLGINYYIDGYVGSDEVVTLPSTYMGKPVVGILDSAFLKNETLKVVNIPEGYKEIEAAAFYQCPNLVSVYVPNTVKNIGEYALSGIRTIFLGSAINSSWPTKWYDDKVSYVYENIDLEDLSISSYYQYLQKEDSYILTNYFGSDVRLELPSTYNNKDVVAIGAYAFGFNKDIELVRMPNTYTLIMNNAFNNCENLELLYLSSNLETIEDSALCYCSSLSELDLPKNLKSIGYGVFNMCTSLIVLRIPEGVTSIGDYAFAWCTGLNKLYLPSTLEYFGQGVIYSCSMLTVYAKHESLPSTWHSEFNPSNRPIKWGYEE